MAAPRPIAALIDASLARLDAFAFFSPFFIDSQELAQLTSNS
jgi:hypothetical protein